MSLCDLLCSRVDSYEKKNKDSDTIDNTSYIWWHNQNEHAVQKVQTGGTCDVELCNSYIIPSGIIANLINLIGWALGWYSTSIIKRYVA